MICIYINEVIGTIQCLQYGGRISLEDLYLGTILFRIGMKNIPLTLSAFGTKFRITIESIYAGYLCIGMR
jgi:hypothetical protein